MVMMIMPSQTHCCNLTNALTGPQHVPEQAVRHSCTNIGTQTMFNSTNRNSSLCYTGLNNLGGEHISFWLIPMMLIYWEEAYIL